MFGSTVSRWTMAHFEVALAVFLLVQLVMIAGVTFPVAPLAAPITLAAVHGLTVGWLSVLMLGALHQFIPVITAQGRVAGTSALVALIAIVAGLGGMEAGFLTLDGWLPPAVLLAMPLGGLLVLTGVVIAAASIGRTLWQTRPLPFSGRFVAAALVFLLAVVGMGIVLGCVFASPRLIPWAGAFTDGLRLHVLAGLVGWFTLTAMGVSYRLLSMFTLAPEERGATGDAVLALSAGGLAATWLLDVAAALGAPVPAPLLALAAVVTGLGLALYVVDMARLYRTRRRQKLELNTGMALPAIAAFAVALVFAGYLGVTGVTEPMIGALGYLFVFGWLSGLGLSQLYKIVPFLTWLERYGSVLGKQAVPRIQDLVDERRDRPWFILYFVSVGLGTVFIAMQWPVPWRLAVLGHLAATIVIARSLWRARRGMPLSSEAAPDLPAVARPPFLT